jgi:hypothetical protein
VVGLISNRDLSLAISRFLRRLRYRLKTLGSGFEYFAVNEWSEGHRHVHVLVRADADLAPQLIRAVWTKTLPGMPFTHHCAPVCNPAGMANYVVKNLKDASKKELAPTTFKGRLYSYSRHFFTQPVAVIWKQLLRDWYPARGASGTQLERLTMKTKTNKPNEAQMQNGKAEANGKPVDSTDINNHADSRTSPEAVADPDIELSDTIEEVLLALLTPATVNDTIYKPVSRDDPSIIALSKDIDEKGLLEPIVATLDDVVVSGHRRLAACQVANLLMVPVRRINILSTNPRFESYLVAFNQQRVKSPIEQIREEVIRTSPEDAHNALLSHRETEAAKAYQRVENAGLRILDPAYARRRSAISAAKKPMLDAVIGVIEQYEDYWPLTLRQIHYRLLTRRVLRNTNDPTRLYVNTEQCYKDLSNLLTRARLCGLVPWESMHDPTRPRTEWIQYDSIATYMREQCDQFLAGYKRNLLQSQPAYVELVVEKITVQDIAKRAASYYHVPVGVGRGYSSVTSLDETAERFRASGKDHFILLIAGDLDPEGENIAQTWGACLQDEHGVDNLTTVKVGVNPDQVIDYNLSPLPVKTTSSRAAGFEAVHGSHVYELEAFEPDQLQDIIREAIRGVLDLNLFAKEQRRESEDARHLMACRKHVQDLLKTYRPDAAS